MFAMGVRLQIWPQHFGWRRDDVPAQPFRFQDQGKQVAYDQGSLALHHFDCKEHADGISKLVYKADLDKMKGSLKDKTVKMEELLKEGWKQVQQPTGAPALKALCFGKFCVRLVLHLLSKEKYSRDQPFESVQEIVDQFGEDLLDGNLKASSSVAAIAPKG